MMSSSEPKTYNIVDNIPLGSPTVLKYYIPTFPVNYCSYRNPKIEAKIISLSPRAESPLRFSFDDNMLKIDIDNNCTNTYCLVQIDNTLRL